VESGLDTLLKRIESTDF